MSKLRVLAVASLVLIAGCFPIELGVSKDGKLLISRQEGFFVFDPASGQTKKIGEPDGGEPVFARFSPDGKEALVVAKVSGGFNKFRFQIVPLSGGAGREIYQAENTAYVAYAPDGAKLAITRAADKEDPATKQKLPELCIVPAQGGASKVIAKNVGPLFRWFADSRRVLVFQIEKKLESNFLGNVAVVDVASGKITPLAAALVDSDSFCDLSPDGKKAMFTAIKADKAGTKLAKGDSSEMTLYELDVDAGTVRNLDKHVRYAIYSPDGKQVLLGGPPEGFSMDTLKLEVGDANLKNLKTIAGDAHMPAITMGGEGVTYPGWINDKSIYYIIEKKTYGTSGKSLALMTVGADGSQRKCVQPLIDTEAINGGK